MKSRAQLRVNKLTPAPPYPICPLTMPHLLPREETNFFLPRKHMPAVQEAMLPWRGSVNLLTRNRAFVFLSSIKGSNFIYNIIFVYYIINNYIIKEFHHLPFPSRSVRKHKRSYGLTVNTFPAAGNYAAKEKVRCSFLVPSPHSRPGGAA